MGVVFFLSLLAAAAVLHSGCNDDDNDDKSLTETISRRLQKTPIPGATVGVWCEGDTPYVRAFGVQNTATGEPMTTDLYVRIGSNTKAFVATCILILADRDELDLDDPIDLYVEGVPNARLHVVGAELSGNDQPTVLLGPDRTIELRVLVTAPAAEAPKSVPVTFRVTDPGLNETSTTTDNFVQP